MLKLPQNINLIDQLMYLFLSELPIIDLLPNHLFLGLYVLDQGHLPECPLSNVLFDQIVLFHILN